MKTKDRVRRWIVGLLLAVVGAQPAGAQSPATPAERSPILVTFDLHMDPMAAAGGTAAGWDLYRSWNDGALWLLSVTEPRGARLSFSCVGQYAEYALADAANSTPLLLRLYASGGSVGTHSHDFYQVGPFTWVSAGTSCTQAEAEQVWASDVGMVDRLVGQALGLTDPAAIRAVNNLRGTHVPSSAAERYPLFQEYGYVISQAGPAEDFAGLFDHYMYHPFRPSTANELAEDRAGPVIMTQAGPVLGSSGVHKGVYQDMTLPRVQARFVAEVLNWLADARGSAPDRVWCFGWGSHGSDVTPTGTTRAVAESMLDWLGAHFIGRRIGGSVLARYGSYAEEGAAYQAWEASHPDLASRSYPSRVRDWSLYPWLVPVAAHLWGATWVAAVRDDDTVAVHQLQAPASLGGPYPIVVAFPTGTTPPRIDLSSLDAGAWVRVNPATGAQGVQPAAAAAVPRAGAIFVPARACPSLEEQKRRIDVAYPVVLR